MKKRFFKFLYVLLIAALLSVIYTSLSMPGIKERAAQPDLLYTERPIFPIYLNAIFIHKDLASLAWVDSLRAQSIHLESYNPFYTVGRNGGKILKNTLGTSLMTLPPFVIAHFLAKKRGADLTGWSLIYLFVYHWYGGMLLLLGLYVLWLVLSFYFSSAAKIVTMTVMVASTYFVDLLQILDQLDLIYLFFLHTSLLYISILFFEKPGAKSAILCGGCLGLIVLIRPVEVALVLMPILWKVSPKVHHLKVRLYHMIKNYKAYLYLMLTTILLIFLQIGYWVKYSGQAFVFNDQLIGVTRDLSRLEAMMIGPKSGVFLYSPILVLMVLGFLWMRGALVRVILPIMVSVLLISLGAIYYYFWWNGGDSGALYINQLYPFLAIPFAALVDFCLRKTIMSLLLWALLGVLTYFNLWRFHDQLGPGVLSHPDITYNYMMAVLGRDTVLDRDLKLLDTQISFDQAIEGDTTLIERRRVFCLNAKTQYSRRLEAKSVLSKKYYRFVLDAITKENETETWKHAQMIISYYQGKRNIGNDLLRIQRVMHGDKWQTVWLDSQANPKADRVAVSIWNADSSKEICFRNLKIIAFDGILQSSNKFKAKGK